VRLSGSVVGDALSGHRLTVLYLCYRYTWAAWPSQVSRQTIACPAAAAAPGADLLARRV